MKEYFLSMGMILFLISGCASINTGKTILPDSGNIMPVKIEKISCKQVRERQIKGENFILIDVRRSQDFEQCHIRGAVSIPLPEINYKKISKDMDIVLYCESPGCPTSKDAAQRLAERGYKNVSVMPGGLRGWKKKSYPVVEIKKQPFRVLVKGISPDELIKKMKLKNIMIVDVRNRDEFVAGHIKGAVNMAFANIAERIKEIEKGREIIVYDRTGSESQKAADILNRAGFENVSTLLGGIMVWEKRGYGVAVD